MEVSRRSVWRCRINLDKQMWEQRLQDEEVGVRCICATIVADLDNERKRPFWASDDEYQLMRRMWMH